jgi:hypothetical protein
LYRAGLARQAITLITRLPDDIKTDPLLRWSLGTMYAAAGWYALAVEAYGFSKDLPRSARRQKRRSWWRSGGPIWFVRRWRREFEENARVTWHRFTGNLDVIDTFDQPRDFEAAIVKGNLDSYLQQLAQSRSVWAAIER